MKKYLFYVLSLFLMWSMRPQAQAQTVHFIGVFQKYAGGIDQDKEAIQATLARIEETTDMGVNKRLFDNEETLAFRNYINALEVDSDDVIWFYFSGCGQNAGDDWPQFSGGGKTTLATRMHDKLKQKGTRLVITMFDCGNLFGCSAPPADTQQLTTTTNTEAVELHRAEPSSPSVIYNRLFKESRGDIKACSSRKGLFAHGLSSIGGVFTFSFNGQIENLSIDDVAANQAWLQLAKATQEVTNIVGKEHIRYMQHPQFSINLD